jgi:Sec-independent protein translocase protein TatA
VFEGLFQRIPTLEKLVQNLLYILSTWHALAKARSHTLTSVSILDDCTTTLGHLLRKFRRQTNDIETKETPKEKEARQRRQAKKAEKDAKAGKQPKRRPAASNAEGDNDAKPAKFFNMFTYKMHTLGAYVRSIMTFGTSDNYSTQPVSLVRSSCI